MFCVIIRLLLRQISFMLRDTISYTPSGIFRQQAARTFLSIFQVFFIGLYRPLHDGIVPGLIFPVPLLLFGQFP